MTSTTPTRFATALAELSDPTAQPDGMPHEYGPYSLASLAECTSPDSSDSPGARFLAGIARDVAERVDVGDIEDGDAEGAWGEAVAAQLSDLTDGDAAHEIADNAVPIYTHDRWATFVDLGAYNEDISEYGSTDDLTNAAGLALFIIAERLVLALAEGLSEARDDDEQTGEGEAPCPQCERTDDCECAPGINPRA